MRFSVLSSGSKANCTLVESGTTRILIDCGLSARETVRRLCVLGVDPSTISAIIVTHEHRDHIYGIPVMSRRHNLPVYANRSTARFLRHLHALEIFKTGHTFSIGEMEISPFSIVHDASDPVGFCIQARGIKFAQATDLGKVTPLVREALRDSHALVLESNHDPEMLRCCHYPWELKQRIASSHGHLSNGTASEFLAELMHSDLRHIVLGHLSENSNTPELALAAAREQVPCERTLLCASVQRETPMLSF